MAPLQSPTCDHKFIVNMTFTVFAKNTTGSSPDMSSELAFLAEEDEWREEDETLFSSRTLD